MFCPACRGEYSETWKTCPKDAATLLRSSRIGKYTITALIGVGGMGAVYRAVNPDTQGEVAIKVMHDHAATSEPLRARFKREAAAVAKLKTSHVVKVYDFGAESDGMLYLVMELLEGHSLRDEIHPPPDTMGLARAQFVIEGMLKGLSAAHKAGIVHRDLKPENIFLANTDDGEVPQILDFGIARIESPDGVIRSGGITRPGTVMGTVAYMAPEQLEGTVSQVGKWSDVYAIGAIVYEMLAGKTQVKEGTLLEVVVQHRRRQYPKLAELRPDLPPALSAVVQRCLEVEPAKRPQDADELRAALAETWGAASFSSISTPPRAKTREAVAATQPPHEKTDPAAATVPDRPSANATVPARPHAVVALAATVPSTPAPVEAKRAPPWIALAVIAAIVVAVIVVLAVR